MYVFRLSVSTASTTNLARKLCSCALISRRPRLNNGLWMRTLLTLTGATTSMQISLRSTSFVLQGTSPPSSTALIAARLETRITWQQAICWRTKSITALSYAKFHVSCTHDSRIRCALPLNHSLTVIRWFCWFGTALQYLYYLSQIGIAMSPLSNNKLFLEIGRA